MDVLDLHEDVVLRCLTVQCDVTTGLKQLPKQPLLRVFTPQAKVLQDMLDSMLLLGLPSLLHSHSFIAHILNELLSFHLQRIFLLCSSDFGRLSALRSLAGLRGPGSGNLHVDCLHRTILVILRVDDILPPNVQITFFLWGFFGRFSELFELILCGES